MEREASVEQLSTTERVKERLLNHFEQYQFGIRKEQFEAFIAEIRTEDLSNDPLAEKVGRTPIAKIDGRRLTYNTGFEQLTNHQQLHTLAHEYSHALSWFFACQPNNEKFQSIVGQIKNLPPQEISYYVSYLDRKIAVGEDKESFMLQEELAEVIAQYLESDRTVAGFMQAKLLEFPQGDEGLSTAERATYQQLAEQIGSVQEYLDIADNEHEREAFLAHHPKLEPHYRLWQSVDEMFRETDFSEIRPEAETIDWAAYDEEQEFWEEYGLAEQLHAEELVREGLRARTVFRSTASPNPQAKVGEVATLWKIFI